jgi:hypothetical protein
MKILIGGGLCLQQLVDDDWRRPPHTRYYKMGWRPIEACINVYERKGQRLAFYIHRPDIFHPKYSRFDSGDKSDES